MSKTIANFDGYAIDMVNGQPCFIEDGEAQPINADHYFCVDPHDYAHLKHMATLDLPADEISAIEAVIEGVYASNPSIDPERHESDLQFDYEFKQNRSAEVWGAAIGARPSL